MGRAGWGSIVLPSITGCSTGSTGATRDVPGDPSHPLPARGGDSSAAACRWRAGKGFHHPKRSRMLSMLLPICKAHLPPTSSFPHQLQPAPTTSGVAVPPAPQVTSCPASHLLPMLWQRGHGCSRCPIPAPKPAPFSQQQPSLDPARPKGQLQQPGGEKAASTRAKNQTQPWCPNLSTF